MPSKRSSNASSSQPSASDWDESRSSPVDWKGETEEEDDDDEEEEVILEEIDSNRFKLTVPKNVTPGDVIEVNNGQGKTKIVKIKAGIKAGDVFVIDFHDREARQMKSSPKTTTTTLDKPSITTSVGIVVKKMVNCGCINDTV